MRLEDLQKGDNISIVNMTGEAHLADFLEFTQEGMHVNFKGFGRLEVKWNGIRLVEHVMSSLVKENGSCSPRYKVVLWQA